MNKEKQKTNKPFDVVCAEEYEKMNSDLIGMIQKSKLPVSVLKLALVQIMNNIILSIDREIDSQKVAYYKDYEKE